MTSVKRKRGGTSTDKKGKKLGDIDEGIQYLGHSGGDVNVVIHNNNNSTLKSITINIYQSGDVKKFRTKNGRKRGKERQRKQRKDESAKLDKKLQEKAAKKAAKKRMRKYTRKTTGKKVSIEEFKCLEENEQMIQRGNMDVNAGMRPLVAYFPPVKEGHGSGIALDTPNVDSMTDRCTSIYTSSTSTTT
jgi:hypothetical protein